MKKLILVLTTFFLIIITSIEIIKKSNFGLIKKTTFKLDFNLIQYIINKFNIIFKYILYIYYLI